MRERTNVGILATVTAQYFFYKVYFMYLLYILCIGLCDCYWNDAEEMSMSVHETPPAGWNRCRNVTRLLHPCRRDTSGLCGLLDGTNEQKEGQLDRY